MIRSDYNETGWIAPEYSGGGGSYTIGGGIRAHLEQLLASVDSDGIVQTGSNSNNNNTLSQAGGDGWFELNHAKSDEAATGSKAITVSTKGALDRLKQLATERPLITVIVVAGVAYLIFRGIKK